jgi:hypothetical protein
MHIDQGVLRPLFAMQHFSNPLSFDLLWSKHLVLCAMESKEHRNSTWS